ncbi:hypothetical protein ACO0SA_002720 [Hanseniaspora valbyensis]
MVKEVYLHDIHKWALSPESFPNFKLSDFSNDINLTLEEDFAIDTTTTNTTLAHILIKRYLEKGSNLWFNNYLESKDLSLTENYKFLHSEDNQNEIQLIDYDNGSNFKKFLDTLESLFNYGQIWNLSGLVEKKTLGELVFPFGEGVLSEEYLQSEEQRDDIRSWIEKFMQMSDVRQKQFHEIYALLKRKGMIAELLFRSLEDSNVDFIEEYGEDVVLGDIDDPEVIKMLQQQEMMDIEEEEKVPELVKDNDNNNSNEKDLAGNQQNYLESRLQYVSDSQLITENKDAVMMKWEYKIMKLSADTLFSKTVPMKGFAPPNPDVVDVDDAIVNVLNIGFGMGIIDTYIQENIETLAQKYPNKQFKHYIIEAHPDVLKQMETKGWFEKKNVVVLKGRWQDELMKLLDDNIFFNGIYYDTFSEHYKDMLELYDIIIGMIKYENGVFSFFNGLGSDCVFFYDIYKDLVKLDLFEKYGLKCEYKNMVVDTIDNSTWDGITKNYFDCPVFYHPMITFNHDM